MNFAIEYADTSSLKSFCLYQQAKRVTKFDKFCLCEILLRVNIRVYLASESLMHEKHDRPSTTKGAL